VPSLAVHDGGAFSVWLITMVPIVIIKNKTGGFAHVSNETFDGPPVRATSTGLNYCKPLANRVHERFAVIKFTETTNLA